MPLVIGTRGSRLALAQAERVCRLLAAREIEVETSLVRTRGDEETGVPLHEIGGQGLFVKALDDAILRGEIDCAVHSMKDIPVKRPDGLATVDSVGREIFDLVLQAASGARTAAEIHGHREFVPWRIGPVL